jgi:hypothetical protein
MINEYGKNYYFAYRNESIRGIGSYPRPETSGKEDDPPLPAKLACVLRTTMSSWVGPNMCLAWVVEKKSPISAEVISRNISVGKKRRASRSRIPRHLQSWGTTYFLRDSFFDRQ